MGTEDTSPGDSPGQPAPGSAGRPDTVTAAFLETVHGRSDRPALHRLGPDGRRETLTWSDYADLVSRAARGLRDLGLRAGDRLVVFTRNRPEFHIVDMAALFLGATPVTPYTGAPQDQLARFTELTGARLGLVENPSMARRLMAGSGAPSLDHVVLVEGDAGGGGNGTSLIGELLDGPGLDLGEASRLVTPDTEITIVESGGTTGPPKAAAFRHRHVVSMLEAIEARLGRRLSDLRIVSWLPLAQIAERLVSHYAHAAAGLEVTTCPEPTRLLEHLRSARPQLFVAVPGVWERFQGGIEAHLLENPQTAAAVRDAMAAEDGVDVLEAKGEVPGPDPADRRERARLVLSGVLGAIGLDDCLLAMGAAAPMPTGTVDFFASLGLQITETYGLMESCGPLTWDPWHPRRGTAGRALPGFEVRTAADGEILARGPSVFDGYLDGTATEGTWLDAGGWLHTGDLGSVDEDGYLTFVDRKVAMIRLLDGHLVSPNRIESLLRPLPLIREACVVGTGRPDVAALLVLDPAVAAAWAAERGFEVRPEGLASHPQVRREVGRELERVNAALGPRERLHRWSILTDTWDRDSGLLTPTLKVRRQEVHRRYRREIDALYDTDRTA